MSDVGHVADPMAPQPEPPTQVDIFEEHEVALVEPAERAVHRGSNDHRRAGGEQDVGLFLEAAGVGLACVVLVGLTVEAHPDGAVVEVLPVPVEHLAGDTTHRRLVLEHFDRGADPIPMGACVRVQQGDVVARGVLDTEVAPAGEAEVRSDSTSTTSGAPVRRMSTLPSPDALSTTTISSCSVGQSRPRTPSIAVSVCSADLKLTMTTDTRGCTAGRA